MKAELLLKVPETKKNIKGNRNKRELKNHREIKA